MRGVKILFLFMASSFIHGQNIPPPHNLESIPVPSYCYPLKLYSDVSKDLTGAPQSYPKVLCLNDYYVGLDFASFKEQNTWIRGVCAQHYPQNIGESFDCDNFAFLYKTLLTTAAFKKKTKGQILIGVILVEQKNMALGIKIKGGRHALNIIYTSKGWYIVEPQTGEFIEYKKYTNPITQYIF